MNIKDPETERLAAEVATLTGESKTGAIRSALRERKRRLELAQSGPARGDRMVQVLAKGEDFRRTDIDLACDSRAQDPWSCPTRR